MQKPLDRITDAYFGNLGESLQLKTRNRVNWIVNNVRGQNILDVGCSQGIVTILVGREGKKILGIDMLQESIVIANENLANESEIVRSDVAFECSNFINRDFKEKFDTIIASEVLEHVGDDEGFLSKIKDLTVENGRVVITVPFGINDYFDHRRTYYFYKLVESIGTYFYIEKVVFLDKWIGVVCINKESSLSINDYVIMYIKDFEKALYDMERAYLNEIFLNKQALEKLLDEKKQISAKLNEANEKYRVACTAVDSYKLSNNEYKSKVEKFNEYERIVIESKALCEKVKNLEYKLGITEAGKEELEKDLDMMQNELITIKEKMAERLMEAERKQIEAQNSLIMKEKELELSQVAMGNYEKLKKENQEKTNRLREFEVLQMQLQCSLEIKEKEIEKNQVLISNYEERNEKQYNEINRLLDSIVPNAETIGANLSDILKYFRLIEEEKELGKDTKDEISADYINLKSLFDEREKSLAAAENRYNELIEINNKVNKEKDLLSLMVCKLEESNKKLNDKLTETNRKYRFVISQNQDYKKKANELLSEISYYKSNVKELVNNEIKNLTEQEKLLDIIRKIQNDHNRLKRAKLVKLSYKYWNFIKRVKNIVRGEKNELPKK